MNRKPPRRHGAPAPRSAPPGAMGAGDAILSSLGMRSGARADFDAVERLLAETQAAPVPGAATLARLRAREKEEARLASLEAQLLAAPEDLAQLELVAHSLRRLERHDRLLQIYRRIQRLAPDREDIAHMIIALSGANAPSRASDAYVRKEFDDFADAFDTTLATWLDYRAPQLVADTVRAALGTAAPTASTIDLGCGTGLAAPLLRPLTRRLEGVDLSPRMLDKARMRGGYDALFEDELGRFLAARPARYSLAVACDVFCYFGALEAPFAAVRAALRPGGLFAFTVERAAQDAVVLGASGRYAHGDAAVRAAGVAAGLGFVSAQEVTLRTEMHRPVLGGCYLFALA